MASKQSKAVLIGLALLLPASLTALAVSKNQDEAVAAKTTPASKATVKAAAKTKPRKADLVHCANLIYGKSKTSVCFSDKFLAQVGKDTHIKVHARFERVAMDAAKLCEYPFAVMTGEGRFTLSDKQRKRLSQYLRRGGFVVASAGCSSKKWNDSFEAEMKKMFPDGKLEALAANHPVFHTVYDITSSRYKSGPAKLPVLKGLELDGKIALIWSPDGLNDTANAGPNCCCCGGNEIKAARKINVNLLAYALTH
jgi:hypothetical protein